MTIYAFSVTVQTDTLQPVRPGVDLLADAVRLSAVALNNLIVGREFLACQLSKERDLLTDDEYSEAVAQLKVRRTKSDLDLVRQAELLTMLAPDAVDSDVAAVALGCSIKDASRALAAALDGARRASADLLPSAGLAPE